MTSKKIGNQAPPAPVQRPMKASTPQVNITVTDTDGQTHPIGPRKKRRPDADAPAGSLGGELNARRQLPPARDRKLEKRERRLEQQFERLERQLEAASPDPTHKTDVAPQVAKSPHALGLRLSTEPSAVSFGPATVLGAPAKPERTLEWRRQIGPDLLEHAKARHKEKAALGRRQLLGEVNTHATLRKQEPVPPTTFRNRPRSMSFNDVGPAQDDLPPAVGRGRALSLPTQMPGEKDALPDKAS